MLEKNKRERIIALVNKEVVPAIGAYLENQALSYHKVGCYNAVNTP